MALGRDSLVSKALSCKQEVGCAIHPLGSMSKQTTPQKNFRIFMIFETEIDKQRWAARMWLTDIWCVYRSPWLQYYLQRINAAWMKKIVGAR